MLLALARWLRLLGYDCCGAAGDPLRPLLARAMAEQRVFLTRNGRLGEQLPKALLEGGRIVRVTPTVPPEQLREVVHAFALDARSFVFTRCGECNAPLARLAGPPPAAVPPRVTACEKEFWACPRCSRIFWRGSHVMNSIARLERWLAE